MGLVGSFYLTPFQAQKNSTSVIITRFLNNFPFKSTNARTFQKKGAKKSRARNETKKQTPCIPGIGSRQEATPKDVILLLHTYTTTLLPTRIF